MTVQSAHFRAIASRRSAVSIGFFGQFDDQSDDQLELMTS
jgi:hypothetical protein